MASSSLAGSLPGILVVHPAACLSVNLATGAVAKNQLEYKLLAVVKLKEQLVGGFNPFEKYARQNWNLPQVGMKIKNI